MNNTVSHRIPVSRAREGQLVRIDTRINRFLMKNGLERGLLSVHAPDSAVTFLPFTEESVPIFPELFRAFRGLCLETVFGTMVRSETLPVPVNLGQLVVGDFQHIVLIPETDTDLTLSLTFTPSPVILKLTSVSFRGKARILPLDAAVERELNDEEGHVTVITPNTSCLLLDLAPDQDDVILRLLERMEVPESASFFSASFRAALFGQSVRLPYRSGKLLSGQGKRLCLVHLTDEPTRHDLYLLQERA